MLPKLPATTERESRTLKQTGAEWRGPCPVHQGDDANFAVNPENGLAYCHSQCGRGWSILQLEQTISGRRWKECRDDVNVIVGRPVRGPAKLTEVATYDYTDAKGEFLFQVVRYEPKTFRQRRRVVKMDGTSAGISWEYNIKGISRVLYRLPKIAAAEQVLIVEGEKDVGNLEKLGFVATCNPGRCLHPRRQMAQELHRELWRGSGLSSFRITTRPGSSMPTSSSRQFAIALRQLKLLAIPEGKDASDWIAAGATREVIQQTIDAAPIIAEQKAAGDGSGESPPTPGALAAAPGTPSLPQIQVNDRPFRLICEEAVGALRPFNDPPNLFVRASRIACIEATELGRPFIADFDDTKTRHHLAQAADFFELSPRGIRREVPPPIDVAKNVRGRNPATWGFPVLEGVAEAPTLRPDGSVLAQPGYDARAGCISSLLPASKTSRCPISQAVKPSKPVLKLSGM